MRYFLLFLLALPSITNATEAKGDQCQSNTKVIASWFLPKASSVREPGDWSLVENTFLNCSTPIENFKLYAELFNLPRFSKLNSKNISSLDWPGLLECFELRLKGKGRNKLQKLGTSDLYLALGSQGYVYSPHKMWGFSYPSANFILQVPAGPYSQDGYFEIPLSSKGELLGVPVIRGKTSEGRIPSQKMETMKAPQDLWGTQTLSVDPEGVAIMLNVLAGLQVDELLEEKDEYFDHIEWERHNSLLQHCFALTPKLEGTPYFEFSRRLKSYYAEMEKNDRQAMRFLSFTIQVDKESLKPGESFEVKIRIKNNGKSRFTFLNTDKNWSIQGSSFELPQTPLYLKAEERKPIFIGPNETWEGQLKLLVKANAPKGNSALKLELQAIQILVSTNLILEIK